MYYSQKSAISKRSRDILVLIILLLMLALAVTSILFVRVNQRDAHYGDVLLGKGSDELGQARASMSQISRIGGSYTTMQISQLRQHLYAMGRLNAIATELYGMDRAIIDGNSIASALDTVTKCESRLLQGQAIDEQLQTLRQILDQIDTQLRTRKI